MRTTALSSPIAPGLRRWPAALAVVVVLAATVLGAGARGATAATLEDGTGTGAEGPGQTVELRQLADQELVWGVHGSFSTYVTGTMAEGTVTLEGGAAAGGRDGVADGTYRFPALEGSQADVAGIDAAFGGTVRFVGHGGLLDLTLSDLRVQVAGSEGVLLADIASRAPGGPSSANARGEVDTQAEVVAYDDLELATLDLSGVAPTSAGDGLATWTAIPATLTAAAVPAFAGAYPAGTVLEPISLTLAVADGTVADPDTGPAPDVDAPAERPETAERPEPGAPAEPGPNLDPEEAEPGDQHGASTEQRLTAAPAALAAPTVATAPVAVTGGFLDWGVKESFRTYITGRIAQGTIQVSGGASTNADGTFRFPARAQGDFDPDTSQVAAAFDGSVTFSGHGYHGSGSDLLQLTISNIRIDASSSGGTLVADVISLPLEGGTANPQPDVEPRTYDDVALAVLGGASPVAAGADGASWLRVPATLTQAGVPAFSEFYPAGAPLDPLSFTLTLSSTPDLPDPPADGGDDPGDPGVTIDKAQVAPGGTITVTGEGFLAGEQVEVWITPDELWVTTVVADASGDVTATFALPASIPTGTHRVELRGISSGKAVSTSSFTVGTGGGGAGGGAAGGGAAGGTGRGGTTTMPRTGTDLTLAVAGGAFVLAGLALVGLGRARRRPVAA